MRNLAPIFSLTLSLCLIPSLSNADGDFRGFEWGTPIDEVRNGESAELVREESNALAYTTEVAGTSMLIIYLFENDRLTQALYRSTENYVNNTNYVRDYENLKELLKEKYGDPDEDLTRWLNDLYRDDPQSYGTAVAAGHLIYLAEWRTESTLLRMMLSGESFEIDLAILYEELASRDERQQKEKEETLDEL